MISLAGKIKRNKLAIKLRNYTNIRPLYLSLPETNNSVSVSDAFCWRTDKGYETEIRFLDVLKLFYHLDKTQCEIIFYTSEGKKIKNIRYNNLQNVNSLKIDKKLLNGIENYGTFYIFHETQENIKNIIVSNKCYTGFSKNNCLPSFVHGNTYAKQRVFNNTTEKSEIIHTSNKKHTYKIQKNFSNIDSCEFFFANPTSSQIKFSINKKNYILKEGCSKIIKLNNIENVEIISNCYYLRPTIFNYKTDYYDVHHA